jgi:hypothetical protein
MFVPPLEAGLYCKRERDAIGRKKNGAHGVFYATWNFGLKVGLEGKWDEPLVSSL